MKFAVALSSFNDAVYDLPDDKKPVSLSSLLYESLTTPTSIVDLGQ